MYLKSLEVQGFKSFPDKTLLQFGSDITAIVGPNGSGKSNISDAIRWVMGEQSTKALRGGKMEDVIFGGTQKRAQVGFAEATLTLDNSDGALAFDAKEVMITRRYYRSGESEFYINKKSARLRDINELFMDTGLGREGYSNISQGRIDEILSLKSGDRREIFEEAAGISKYRHRKEETERRLAHTDENLLRIGDKISELELQIEPLRQQAEKAKKYLAFREELKGLEITVWLEQLTKLAATAEKAEADYNAAAFILQQQHENLEHLYQLAETLTTDLRSRDTAIDEQREHISQLDAAQQQLTAEINLLQSQQDNNERNIARVEEELAAQDSRSGGIAEQISQRQTHMQELAEQMASLEQDLDAALEESRAMAESADALTRHYLQLREEQANALARQAGLVADQNASLETQAQLTERKAQMQRDLNAAAERKAHTLARKQTCEQQLGLARDGVQSVRNAISGYQLRLKTRKEKKEQLQKQFDEQSVLLNTLQAQIRMYEDMERAYKGFSDSVRVVMQQRDRGALHHVHGTVAQLIRTEDTYTVAIETALGGGMQNIVVESEQDAKAAMQLLKRQKGGRATFLPVQTMKPAYLRENGLERTPGFVGIAADLIQYDERYDGVMRHLLGRIAIMETLDSAIAAANRFGHRFKIVTLDGQVMNAGGSMTGGSIAKSAGFLTRANELERLQADAEQLKGKHTTLEAQLREAARSAQQAEFEMETAGTQLRQREDEVLRLEGELRQHQVLLDAICMSLDGAQREQAETDTKLSACADKLKELETELAQCQQRLQESEEKLNQADMDQAAASELTGKTADRITTLKMEISALDAEKTTEADAVTHLQQLAQQMQGDRTEKERLVAVYRSESQRYQSQREALCARQTEQSDEIARQRTALTEALQDRKQVEEKKTRTEKDAQDANRDILNMERESARLEQRKLSAQMEEKQIVDKLWDAYQLTPSTAGDMRVEVESTAMAQRRITELKRKIGQLGTPNLGAVEEFDRVNERYQYLTEQRDDVLHAKNDLMAIIRDITVQMTDIFTTEFAKINTYFGQTFTEMFGGGKASLALDDPEQPLTCGIEINVQPPGKQLKTITLLSGGEKAFVAIALYFAILKVRPTPFCMLDEIDAALDDRNVERFANYLRTFANKTQFIVITHRRGTMEASDVLYGVTMQEQGVSKMLHLDLSQMEQILGIQE